MLELDSRKALPPAGPSNQTSAPYGPYPLHGSAFSSRHAPIWLRGLWEMWANSRQVRTLTLSVHCNPQRAPHATGRNLPRPPSGHAHIDPGRVGEGNPDVQLPGACRAPPSAAFREASLSSAPGTPLPHPTAALTLLYPGPSDIRSSWILFPNCSWVQRLGAPKSCSKITNAPDSLRSGH